MQGIGPDGGVQPHFHYFTCTNRGAFVSRFIVQRFVEGRLISQTRILGRLSMQDTRSIDLTTLRFHGLPLEVGDQVRLRIGAVGGVRRNGPLVHYAPNGQTAAFEVRGTTLAFSIRQL
ncbi:hypothetical protein [Lysobacter silvisoli]|uniref:Uncharacterized protein n=1 Tax=Lysobacter silvisoli TaxID=2293254 RepID=A0A371JX34_9GAMM|nr:hypothetical protein [Lysobacter silvisoli]RDZ26210.1 hypothetical protein DX914_18220 [Lysobacter silvisoli]